MENDRRIYVWKLRSGFPYVYEYTGLYNQKCVAWLVRYHTRSNLEQPCYDDSAVLYAVCDELYGNNVPQQRPDSQKVHNSQKYFG